jgi:hypothetical protein
MEIEPGKGAYWASIADSLRSWLIECCACLSMCGTPASCYCEELLLCYVVRYGLFEMLPEMCIRQFYRCVAYSHEALLVKYCNKWSNLPLSILARTSSHFPLETSVVV